MVVFSSHPFCLHQPRRRHVPTEDKGEATGEVLSRGKGYMAHSSIDQQVIGRQRLSLSSLAVVNALWAAHRLLPSPDHRNGSSMASEKASLGSAQGSFNKPR
jgi:hypothetical protein